MSNVKDLAYQDYLSGMKYKDIAEKHGTSLSAVKSWAYRDWKKDVEEKLQPDTEKVAKKVATQTATQTATKEKKLQPKKEALPIEKKLIESVEQNEELTDKQKLFCLCYIKNFNATQAAINAGYTENYPSEIGYQLLQKTTVQEEVKRLKDMKAKAILITEDDIVERYMKMAFSDITDFVDFGLAEVPVIANGKVVTTQDAATGKPIPMLKTVSTVRFKDSMLVDGGLISEISQGKDGSKIKLEDRQKALDWLSRYFLMNPLDKHKIEYDKHRLTLEEKKATQDAGSYDHAEQFFKLMRKIYRNDPVGFCRQILEFEPDEWQKAVLNDIANSKRVTVRSAQGVGKTGIEACALLWFLACFEAPRVVATAPTRQQLNDVLWSEISKWQNKSEDLKTLLEWTKTRISRVDDSERCFAVARTATRPENMQGFHEDNMLFIVDEASGVANDIMEAILGTLSGENNKLLMCGNPTKRTGVFYDSHTRDKELFKAHKISSYDSKRANKENAAMLIKKFGEHSNVVRVRVLGEFPIDEDDVFISTALAEGGVHTEQNIGKVETIDIGVDVARHGNDSTVIATKINNAIMPLIVKHGQDLMGTANQVMTLAKEKHEKFKKKVVVKIDDTGLGGGVTDRLLEMKAEQGLTWLIIIPVNMATSSKHAYYGNITTVMWGALKELLEDKELSLPDDAELIGELTNRKKVFSSKGRIILESKDDMKKRGLQSPDRADAVVLAAFNVNININQRAEGGDDNRK